MDAISSILFGGKTKGIQLNRKHRPQVCKNKNISINPELTKIFIVTFKLKKKIVKFTIKLGNMNDIVQP